MGTEADEDEDENELRIEPRPGLEVFHNKGGRISIRQIDWTDAEEVIVVVHPDDVPRLIELLNKQLSMISEYEHGPIREG